MFILISTGGADGTSESAYMRTLIEFQRKNREAQRTEEAEKAQKKAEVKKPAKGPATAKPDEETPQQQASVQPPATGTSQQQTTDKTLPEQFALELEKIKQQMAMRKAKEGITDSEKS